MSITLTRGATTLDLPDDMLWPNEFAWSAVEVNRRYSISGALISDTGSKQVGRPITLQGGANYAWMPRSTLVTLRAWADAAPEDMTLVCPAGTFTVQFDYALPPIEATPVIDYADPDTTDNYAVTLHLIVTEA